MSSFPDQVAELCYQHFDNLPKKGKPQPNTEWTLLAAVVLNFENKNKKLKVVAMSTGTKCLGESQLSSTGDTLSDSHAEVLARRAFIRFLYHQMNLLLQKKPSEVLGFNENLSQFYLKPEVKIIFFCSHVPCGDSAIFPKSKSDSCLNADFDSEPKQKKLKRDSIGDPESESLQKDLQFEDIYRTGAKCIKGDSQDPKMPGKDYHIIGVLRTKPGRGIPTLSMSCSDKIALWNVCGLQGSLLSHVLESPIYVTSFIFGKCPFSEKSVERAVYERLSAVSNLRPSYCITKPDIQQSNLSFKFSRENITKINDKVVPCSSSIIWSDVPDSLEVSVGGKKQGVTKKNINKPYSRISICRQVLFENFLCICKEMSQYSDKYKYFINDKVTYLQCKLAADDYQAVKKEAFKIFKCWVQKPKKLQEFYVSLEK